MAENAVLNRSISQIDVDFVEREATPRLLMKLSIQLHLANLSLSNTISIFDYSVLDGRVQQSIIGSTRPTYSPTMEIAGSYCGRRDHDTTQ
jgi:hypothetical protein